MRKVELLAPAGNMECLRAAIEAGCDAIYLGGYIFGARSFAGNFSNDEIIEAIKYAHLYRVKIYVTVNTVVYENEIDTFISYIDFLHINNVDAVIIQDLGMLDLIRQTYPNLEVHASTQMHIHNEDGVKILKKIGVKRAVIARETSVEEIRQIKKNVDMELEVFIHGALCVSYSGQCLMSSLIGGRSGNRGTCAQSCRQKYSLISDGKRLNQDDYLLSMKDLNTLEYIGDLIDSGVDSFKIEGRMKRPEYVYLVVSIYRKAIDNYLTYGVTKVNDNDIIELKKIFNRMFTKGFLFNENSKNIINHFRPNHLGIGIGKVVMSNNGKISIKLSDDLKINDGVRIIGKPDDVGFTVTKMLKNNQPVKEAIKGDTVTIYSDKEVLINSEVLKTTDNEQLKSIEESLKKLNRKVLISGIINLKMNKKIKLIISDGKNNVEVISDTIVTKANSNAFTKEIILKQLNRLGNTIFLFDKIDVVMDEDIFVPVSILNNLRREAISKLEDLRLYKINYKKESYSNNVPDIKLTSTLNALIKNVNQYDMIKDKKIDYIYVEEKLFNQLSKDERSIVKYPRVLSKYNVLSSKAMIGELGGFNLFSIIHTDFSFNVTNSYTVAFLNKLGATKVTLSYELDKEQIKAIIDGYKKRYNKMPNLELIIYGKEEIMITKYNLFDYFDIKNNMATLKDRFNNSYPIENNNNSMTIYNYNKRNLSIEEYKEIGITNFRYNLLEETNIDTFI